MDSLEQAREALTPSWLSHCCVCGRIVDTRESHQGGDAYGCELNDGRWTCSEPCWSSIVDPNSPTTPVDGVGAEPRVKPLGRERMTTRKLCDECEAAGDCRAALEGFPETCDALANPEAEARLRDEIHDLCERGVKQNGEIARLRERVAELEAQIKLARDEAWMWKERAAHGRKYAALCEAAEARLAQAEDGPAVTDEMVASAQKAADDALWKWRGLGKRKDGEGLDGMYFVVRDALEAALHPQSAAGEEGK